MKTVPLIRDAEISGVKIVSTENELAIVYNERLTENEVMAVLRTIISLSFRRQKEYDREKEVHLG